MEQGQIFNVKSISCFVETFQLQVFVTEKLLGEFFISAERKSIAVLLI